MGVALLMMALRLGVLSQQSVMTPTGLQEFVLNQREALKGMRVVTVSATVCEPFSRYFTAAMAQTAVELRLRQAGVTVSDSTADPSIPAVLAEITCFNDVDASGKPTGTVYFMQEVSVTEITEIQSFAPNVKRMGPVTVWQKTAFGAFGVKHFSEVKPGLENVLDVLVNDWLTVNPRKYLWPKR